MRIWRADWPTTALTLSITLPPGAAASPTESRHRLLVLGSWVGVQHPLRHSLSPTHVLHGFVGKMAPALFQPHGKVRARPGPSGGATWFWPCHTSGTGGDDATRSQASVKVVHGEGIGEGRAWKNSTGAWEKNVNFQEKHSRKTSSHDLTFTKKDPERVCFC